MRQLLLLFLSIISVANSFGQLAPYSELIKVFLDGNFVDVQYIKDNLTIVNYVRDFRDADIYVMSISQRAGNGGEVFTLIFEGQKKFSGRRDTIKFNTLPNISFDQKRELMLKYLMAGLMPYLSQTQAFESLDLASILPENQKISSATKQITEDNWHNWVFTLGISGNYRSEATYQSLRASQSFRALKVTEKIIADISSYYSYSYTTYQISEDYTVTSFRKEYALNSLTVLAINNHWSWGVKSGLGKTTYKNLNFYLHLKPALEFNLFPYTEATVRQMRFLYQIGLEQNYYIDTTIYNKINESLLRQELSVAYQVRKKWGTANVSLYGGNYLHDFSKNSFRLSSSLNFRIIKGMSLWVSGSVGLIHDQLYLPKGEASLEEILTRQQQLATQYTYRASMGLSYTFGSIYNNIVNPRFGRG